MLRKFLHIFTLSSFALIITLGGTALAYGDEPKINQDFPFLEHGIILIYEKDVGSTEDDPTVGTLSDGTQFRNYVLNLKEDNPDGSKVFVSNFIKLTTGQTNWQQWNVVPGTSSLRVNINGIWSDWTQTVSDTSKTPVDLWIDGYRDLYPINLDIDCESDSSYGNGIGPTNDDDSDGLCDAWEDPQTGLNVFDANNPSEVYRLTCTPGIGYDVDHLGTTVCPDPFIPDIYYEIDSLIGHRPDAFALAKVASSFETSGYKVGSTETGIHAHFQISDGNLPHADSLPMPGGGILSGYDALKRVGFGTDSDRGFGNPSPENFWDAPQRHLKSQVFHYIIFGHSLYGSSSQVTGYSEIPGNDALVTLGGWDYSVGNEDHQAGTVMHEIGHNLNLHHGGDDSVNCKPNYLSVMSYSRQFPDLIQNRPLDFSDDTLRDFSEGSRWRVPNGLTTVYGVNGGTSSQVVVGVGWVPNTPDPNKIDSVTCDGLGTDFIGYNDLDNLVLLDRSFGTFDEGRGSQTDPSDVAAIQVLGNIVAEKAREEAISKHVSPSQLAEPSIHKACNENIIDPIVKNSDLSNTRTCIRESLSYEDVVKIRGPAFVTFRNELSSYFTYIEPSCQDEIGKTLAGIEADIKREVWADAEFKIQELLVILNSEGCISDPQIREEVIEMLNNRLQVILRAVPEFETMTIIILSISIITVIAITRRSKLNLSLMGQ